MKYVRTVVTEIPDFKYFRDELGWDIQDKEDLLQLLNEYTDVELYDNYLEGIENDNVECFAYDITFFNRLED